MRLRPPHLHRAVVGGAGLLRQEGELLVRVAVQGRGLKLEEKLHVGCSGFWFVLLFLLFFMRQKTLSANRMKTAVVISLPLFLFDVFPHQHVSTSSVEGIPVCCCGAGVLLLLLTKLVLELLLLVVVLGPGGGGGPAPVAPV